MENGKNKNMRFVKHLGERKLPMVKPGGPFHTYSMPWSHHGMLPVFGAKWPLLQAMKNDEHLQNLIASMEKTGSQKKQHVGLFKTKTTSTNQAPRGNHPTRVADSLHGRWNGGSTKGMLSCLIESPFRTQEAGLQDNLQDLDLARPY